MADHESYLDPYRKAVSDHGDDFAATLWNSPKAQVTRFDVLLEMIGPERVHGKVVIDLGCGRGDLPLHLEARGIRPAKYIGVDAIPELATIADERTNGVSFDREFAVIDVIRAPQELLSFGADTTLASGTLNAMDLDIAGAAIGSMVRASREAVAFNFLTSRVPEARLNEDTGPANRFDPLWIMDLVLGFSPLVSFRQDHLSGHDAAVAVLLG